jgi:uncharacterized protein YkuJ
MPKKPKPNQEFQEKNAHSTLMLGALTQHGTYVYPRIASKTESYFCPECQGELILCQGDIRTAYFRHKVTCVDKQSCAYFDAPSESQLHKDAKYRMKQLLEDKINVTIIRHCDECEKPNEVFEIPVMTDTSNIVLEHIFDFEGKRIADVAYLDQNELVTLFEVKNWHKTVSTRPEPWFEFDATDLLTEVQAMYRKIDGGYATHPSIQLKCIRTTPATCNRCKTEIRKNTRNYTNAVDLDHFVYLNVPFTKKDEAKQMGGRWDTLLRLWYFPKQRYEKHAKVMEAIGQPIIWKGYNPPLSYDCDFCNGMGWVDEVNNTCFFCNSHCYTCDHDPCVCLFCEICQDKFDKKSTHVCKEK